MPNPKPAILQRYQDALQRAQQRASAQNPRPTSQQLLLLILLLSLTGALLTSTSGSYQYGFLPLNAQLHQLLPDSAWAWLTRFGDERLIFLLSLILACRRPELFWQLIIAALIAGLTTRALKLGIALPRPPAVLNADQIHAIGPQLHRHAFPSGHSVTIFTACAVLSSAVRKNHQKALLLTFAGLVALSRVALGVHWPNDILAGASLGLFAAACAQHIAPKLPIGLKPKLYPLLLIVPLYASQHLLRGDSGNPHTPGLILLIAALVLWQLQRHCKTP